MSKCRRVVCPVVSGLFLLLLVAQFASCDKNRGRDPKENMTFRKVVYADSPSKELALGKGKKCIDGDSLPLKDIRIVDSLMFLETNRSRGIIEVLSTGDLSSRGSFINAGNSIGEFPVGILISIRGTFLKNNGNLYAILSDQITARTYSWNVTSSLQTGDTRIEEFLPDTEVPQGAFWVKILPDSTFWVKELNEDETMQKRWLIKGKERKTIPNMEFADEFAVPKGKDFNLLSTLPGVSPDGTKCVEAMLNMNYINVYSANSGKGYTVCYGEKLDRLSDALAKSEQEQKYMFAKVRTYDDGFAVLKYDITYESFLSGKTYTPSILLFDWDGKMLGELKPGIQFSSFDIDKNNHTLYVLSGDGCLWQYEILQ